MFSIASDQERQENDEFSSAFKSARTTDEKKINVKEDHYNGTRKKTNTLSQSYHESTSSSGNNDFFGMLTNKLQFSSQNQPSSLPSVAAASSNEEQFSDNKMKMETKLMSIWHNVKYGWKGKLNANFSKEQPIWLLGIYYHQKNPQQSSPENDSQTMSHHRTESLTTGDFDYDEGSEIGTEAGDNSWIMNDGIEGFKRDFISRIWMTYRREFPLMTDSKYTSDCGWGCMLRSGQMMLAQALLCHFLGRSWRYDSDTQLFSTHEDVLHRKIVRWFGDTASKNCPFSIHTLVKLGAEMGKKPGDWYGPGSVAHLLKQAVKIASLENTDLDGLNVYVAQNSTIYLTDLLEECVVLDQATQKMAPWQTNQKSHIQSWKPLVLLIPVRLGAEKLNTDYENNLKAFLSIDYCVGIIGGRPKHSLYFVGFQEDKLIHLDPHYCQDMVDVNDENFPLQSFHCRSPRKLKFSKMDPSCCIGFYCRTREDFDNLRASVEPFLPATPSRSLNRTVFTFNPGRSSDDAIELVTSLMSITCNTPSNSGYYGTTDDEDETEEFIII